VTGSREDESGDGDEDVETDSGEETSMHEVIFEVKTRPYFQKFSIFSLFMFFCRLIFFH